MTALRLVVFDVDGTLVDSQGDILAAMRMAFERAGMPPPDRDTILSIVGLSLEVALPRLAPGAPSDLHAQMVEWYKQAYMQLRQQQSVEHSSPLYPNVRDVLDQLRGVPETLLGVATGKSRRGLDKLLEGHGLTSHFITQQVADHHPSKPHPSMLTTALSETGVEAKDAVMIGDTSFDMEMARAAGMRAIGVSWGYHDRPALQSAHQIIDDMSDLPSVLAALWETAP